MCMECGSEHTCNSLYLSTTVLFNFAPFFFYCSFLLITEPSIGGKLARRSVLSFVIVGGGSGCSSCIASVIVTTITLPLMSIYTREFLYLLRSSNEL